MRLSLKLHLDYSFHIAYSEIFPFTVCLLNLIQFDWHESQKALHFTVCTHTDLHSHTRIPIIIVEMTIMLNFCLYKNIQLLWQRFLCVDMHKWRKMALEFQCRR